MDRLSGAGSSRIYKNIIIGSIFALSGLSITQKADAQERDSTRLEIEFKKFLDHVHPNLVQQSYEDYISEKDRICIKNEMENSVEMSYMRTDGSKFSIHYTLQDKNRDGKIERIFVDFEESDDREDVTIIYDDYAFSRKMFRSDGSLPKGYTQYANFYDFSGTCIDTVIHAVLDSEPEGQSCHCLPCPLTPLEPKKAFVVPQDNNPPSLKLVL